VTPGALIGAIAGRASSRAIAFLAVLVVTVLFVMGLAFVILVAPSQTPGAPGGVAAVRPSTAVPGTLPLRGAVSVAAVAVPTSIDLAAFHATAEMALGRSPAERQAGGRPTFTPTPATAPPPKPGVSAKSGVAEVAKQVATPQATDTIQLPATPTRPPTRTPTVTPTETPSATPTPTPTPTPLPSPCTAPIRVPRLHPGYGYLVIVNHETPGHLLAQWPVQRGTILIYKGRPPAFGLQTDVVIGGVPGTPTLLVGTSGTGGVRLHQEPAGEYAFYFFNGSAGALPEVTAALSYWTYGHCP